MKAGEWKWMDEKNLKSACDQFLLLFLLLLLYFPLLFPFLLLFWRSSSFLSRSILIQSFVHFFFFSAFYVVYNLNVLYSLWLFFLSFSHSFFYLFICCCFFHSLSFGLHPHFFSLLLSLNFILLSFLLSFSFFSFILFTHLFFLSFSLLSF